jgi:hypothetical protein
MERHFTKSYETVLSTAMASISLEKSRSQTIASSTKLPGPTGNETQIKQWVQEAYTSCVFENNSLWLQHMRVHLIVFADRKGDLLVITAYQPSEPQKHLKLVIDQYPYAPISELQHNTLLPKEYESEFLAVLLPYLFKQNE